jgi:NAD-reducing hydrogenase large subunit
MMAATIPVTPRKITIEPVTRIEGHAKVTLVLDDAGKVESARMHVNEIRGFEKFCEGRMYFEMPAITPRICGICPVSHHLASAKACDAVAGVTPPRTAQLLRELLHMGQFIQSHALHFFYLAAPDLLFGMDSDPAARNVLGLVAANPELALQAVWLRKYGQEIIAHVGGRRIHPNAALVGGVNEPLLPEGRDAIAAGIDRATRYMLLGIGLIRGYLEANRALADSFARFSSGYMGLVDPDGKLALYDGKIRLVDAGGAMVVDQHPPADYLSIIAEHVENWSYLKFPYYRPWGYPAGAYRVGPLARLNVANSLGTPLADAEFARYRTLGKGRPVEGSLYYHYARMIEGLYAVERAERLVRDPEICGEAIRVEPPTTLKGQGVGVVEAPRGTLIHHYEASPDGRLTGVNLIVSTGHNNTAMNRAVELVAREYVDGTQLREGMLNRVEAAIRCYDPCLSCSTHAIGQMPLVVELCDSTGVLDRQCRG